VAPVCAGRCGRGCGEVPAVCAGRGGRGCGEVRRCVPAERAERLAWGRVLRASSCLLNRRRSPYQRGHAQCSRPGLLAQFRLMLQRSSAQQYHPPSDMHCFSTDPAGQGERFLEERACVLQGRAAIRRKIRARIAPHVRSLQPRERNLSRRGTDEQSGKNLPRTPRTTQARDWRALAPCMPRVASVRATAAEGRALTVTRMLVKESV